MARAARLHAPSRHCAQTIIRVRGIGAPIGERPFARWSGLCFLPQPVGREDSRDVRFAGRQHQDPVARDCRPDNPSGPSRLLPEEPQCLLRVIGLARSDYQGDNHAPLDPDAGGQRSGHPENPLFRQVGAKSTNLTRARTGVHPYSTYRLGAMSGRSVRTRRPRHFVFLQEPPVRRPFRRVHGHREPLLLRRGRRDARRVRLFQGLSTRPEADDPRPHRRWRQQADLNRDVAGQHRRRDDAAGRRPLAPALFDRSGLRRGRPRHDLGRDHRRARRAQARIHPGGARALRRGRAQNRARKRRSVRAPPDRAQGGRDAALRQAGEGRRRSSAATRRRPRTTARTAKRSSPRSMRN